MLYRLWNTNEDNSSDAAEMSSAGRLKEIINVLRQRELLQGITPVKVKQVLEDLGPTFVKLGQIISMRPDFCLQNIGMSLPSFNLMCALWNFLWSRRLSIGSISRTGTRFFLCRF